MSEWQADSFIPHSNDGPGTMMKKASVLGAQAFGKYGSTYILNTGGTKTGNFCAVVAHGGTVVITAITMADPRHEAPGGTVTLDSNGTWLTFFKSITVDASSTGTAQIFKSG